MDHIMTIEELITTITEFYDEIQEKERTIIKPLETNTDTLQSLIYLLYQHSKTGIPLSTQILRFISDYNSDDEFEEIFNTME